MITSRHHANKWHHTPPLTLPNTAPTCPDPTRPYRPACLFAGIMHTGERLDWTLHGYHHGYSFALKPRHPEQFSHNLPATRNWVTTRFLPSVHADACVDATTHQRTPPVSRRHSLVSQEVGYLDNDVTCCCFPTQDAVLGEYSAKIYFGCAKIS